MKSQSEWVGRFWLSSIGRQRQTQNPRGFKSSGYAGPFGQGTCSPWEPVSEQSSPDRREPETQRPN
jgi:hypothetical protein